MKKWKIIETTPISINPGLALEKLYQNRDHIKPYIIRLSSNRIEILVQEQKHRRALEIIEETGLEVTVRNPIEPRECKGIETIQELITSERFYEAHICSEALEEKDKNTGECLALYTALLVKITESSQIGVMDLSQKLLSRENCRRILDYNCVKHLIEEHGYDLKKISGTEALNCILNQAHT